MFLDRSWLGGWKKSSFPAVGNMSKGMETGNCKPCLARTVAWVERRSLGLMQQDSGQNYGLEGDLGDPAPSPEGAFGDLLKASKKRKERSQLSCGSILEQHKQDVETRGEVLVTIWSHSKTKNGELKVIYGTGSLSFILIFSIGNMFFCFVFLMGPRGSWF